MTKDVERLKSYAKALASKVDEIIFSVLRGSPKELYDAAQHLLKAGGKRLRPLLVVLSARLVGGEEAVALYAGAAVELLHNFTLVHDDIMDRDETRRGVPTVHKIWGEAMAILAGDLLFSKAYEALMLTSNVSCDRKLKAAEILTWAAATVAEGQALDMMLAEKDVSEVSVDDYFKMIEKKTAALFKASAEIGCIIGGGTEKDVEALGEYGLNLGIAFQLKDDILGIVGDQSKIGKPVYSDIREGKKTLPILYTISRASPEEREVLSRALGCKDQEARDILKEAAEIIIKLGGIDYAHKVAEEYVNKAIQALNKVKAVDSEARDMLEVLALYTVKRDV